MGTKNPNKIIIIGDMVFIQLTQGQIGVLDTNDYSLVKNCRWLANKMANGFYVEATVNKKKIKMHRLILGLTDSKVDVDHINHDTLDNRRCNLRACSRSQNSMNRLSRNGSSSKWKGVCWSKKANKWQASIRINGMLKYLGLFHSETEAAKVYNVAAIKNFEGFSYLNK